MTAEKVMKYKCFAVTSVLILPFIGAALCMERRRAEANSAPPYWEGSDASGVVVKGEKCPVVVEHETLNLKISTLPYGGWIDSATYGAEVVAQYSFYNPTDLEVDMTLLFPFGLYPSYALKDASDGISAVAVDGESTECTVRYSYAAYAPYVFNIDADMARVQDEKKFDPFYAEDMPVTRYGLTCTVPSVSKMKECYCLKIKLGFNPQRTRLLFPAGCEARLNVVDGDMYACIYLREAGQKTIEFYAAGEAPYEVSPHVYDGDSEIAAVDLLTSEKTTFSEFVLAQRSEEIQVGDIDWYNAFVDMLNEKSGRKDGSVSGFWLERTQFMRWYEYRMTLPAGGRAENSVRAPLYPTVDGRSDARFIYTYLLSPAGKWADFQKIDITIETPFYLSNGSLPFEEVKTEEGFSYRYSRDSLPQGELTFVLTEQKLAGESQGEGRNFLLPTLTWAFVTLFVLAILAAVVTLIVVLSLRKKKK